ncbi:MAG: hypothetical protein JOZ77_10580 [Candidatus Eremiobacteraeota bacterium]|nr:hypothetical protein [Candidatus Eremiobacteraeota bacterium]
MTNSNLGRNALCAFVVAVLLTACDALRQAQDDTPPVGVPSATTQVRGSGVRATALRSSSSSYYEVLFRFGQHANPRHDIGGALPEGLLAVGGELYGTTAQGGYRSSGTVYSASTLGAHTVLHRFGVGSNAASDGVNPVGTLIAVKSLLYGATIVGGKCGSGSVYSISTSGTETLLHSFCGSDGIQPLAGLVNVNGTLYGTTEYGVSSENYGTVYSVATSGTFKIVHNFTGSPKDGAEPAAPLLDVNGTLYGTTGYGGSNELGTVFTIDAAGKEKVLYSFQGGADGAQPFSDLIDVNGTLYGTTLRGGGHHVGCAPSYAGCGTVYSITPSGSESVLYSFGCNSCSNAPNGASPSAGLVELNGVLYGTTTAGGSDSLGVVFSLTPSGSEKVLHNFAGGSDGADPSGGLIDLNGTFYGTTAQGGSTTGCKRFGGSGCGTIFTLTP